MSSFKIILLMLGIFSWPILANSPNQIEWSDFDEGLKKAKRENKYIFIDFYADWCKICKEFEATTLKLPEVAKELNQNFVSVKVNTDSQKQVVWKDKKMSMQEFSGKLNVGALPTMMYLSPEYDVLGSYSSYADGDLFLNLLTYISSGSRSANLSFEEFLENKKK